MSSGILPVTTTSLVMIRGTSTAMNVRGRLFEVTGPQKLSVDSEGFYCRAILADDSGVAIQVTCWNLDEPLYDHILSLRHKCVVLSAVQSTPSRDGYKDLHDFCISFNGGVVSGSSKQKRNQAVSIMAELSENPAFPSTLPTTRAPSAFTSPPPRISASTSSIARVTPTVSPASPELTPKKRAMSRPEDLVRFKCMKCKRGAMPSCGVDGNPHAVTCVKCGFLEAPIVPFCPVTGEAHFDYTTM